MNNNDITIALTSCGRFNLLKRTILSMEKNINTDGCKKILTEDSKDIKHIEKMKKENESGFLKGWEIIYTGGSDKKNSLESHFFALKTLYNKIDSEYIFHMEDDRLFTKSYPNLFDECKKILKNDKHVGIICVRNLFQKTECNLFISNKKRRKMNFLDNMYTVLGKQYLQYKPYSDNSELFTLNPGLRRTKEMEDIMFNYETYVNEKKVGERYKKLGLITINIPICKHIGGLIRSTRFFKDGFLGSFYRTIKNGIKYYYHLLFKGEGNDKIG